jgi:hypothetical protein
MSNMPEPEVATVIDLQGEDAHTCHFCGTYVLNGYECGSNKDKRHWLSDCRPDLVEHEEGPLCTWQNVIPLAPRYDCYAFEYGGDKETNYKRVWTNEHKYFYSDGPM